MSCRCDGRWIQEGSLRPYLYIIDLRVETRDAIEAARAFSFGKSSGSLAWNLGNETRGGSQ